MKVTFIIADNGYWVSEGMEPTRKRSVTLELTGEQVKKVGIKRVGRYTGRRWGNET